MATKGGSTPALDRTARVSARSHLDHLDLVIWEVALVDRGHCTNDGSDTHHIGSKISSRQTRRVLQNASVRDSDHFSCARELNRSSRVPYGCIVVRRTWAMPGLDSGLMIEQERCCLSRDFEPRINRWTASRTLCYTNSQLCASELWCI